LGSGLAGGADVILIPEIPYDIEKIAEAIRWRTREGKNFSIMAVAEGAMSIGDNKVIQKAVKKKEDAKNKKQRNKAKAELKKLEKRHVGNTQRLSAQIEELTGLESRLTILGHVQRGGTPSAVDRVLATKLGAKCAKLIERGEYGVMVAVRPDGKIKPVPLEKVVGKRKAVPLDHPWIEAGRMVGTSFGDQDLHTLNGR